MPVAVAGLGGSAELEWQRTGEMGPRMGIIQGEISDGLGYKIRTTKNNWMVNSSIMGEDEDGDEEEEFLNRQDILAF